MDKNLADNAPDVDNENEAGQAVEDCLRNPLIVRTILEHFSSKELLQNALVDKLWKSEARSVLSRRGNLFADLQSRRLPGGGCDAVAFVSDLPQLGAAPFSGVRFDINYHYGHNVCSLTPEEQAPIQAVDQMSLKNVSVRVAGPWWNFKNCPGFLLAKKVLQRFCEDLEELELSVTSGQQHYITEVIQNYSFPRLQIFRVSCYESGLQNERHMGALLSHAPKLKRLHTDMNIDSALDLLQGTSIEFVHTAAISAPFDWLSDNVISATRFEWMEWRYTGPWFNFERFNRIAPILLQASRTSIRSMTLDAVFAMRLMCYGARLENVKILRMDIDYGRMEMIEPRILNIVKNFDFTRIFPSLDQVSLSPWNDYKNGLARKRINAFIERVSAVHTEPLLDRAARIKKLSVDRWQPTSEAAQFFLEMFPNVEKLEIKGDPRSPAMFEYIWKWLDLTELKFQGNILPTTGNLDSVFCGIFPEEVAQLKLMDDEYLKKVNIVPVMPAVTCLRKLRTINLHHWHEFGEPFVDEDATFIFSKVTALLAFGRQPGLVVNLRITACTDPPAMTHLEPYVSVAFDGLWGEEETT